MPAERLLNLDMLRFVSAMLVVVHHYAFRMQVTGEGGGIGFSEVSDIAIWLDTGLLIFFAISGYVITLSSEGRTALEFAIGRFARLWPTFVLCASITAIVLYNWPVPGLPDPTIKQWLSHAIINSRLLGQPFLDGAYWTIAYEIIFYGWVFVLMAAGWFHRFWKLIVFLWVLLSALNEFHIDSEILRKLLITEYSGYFAFGMTLYKVRYGAGVSAMSVLVLSILLACLTPFFVEPKNFEIYGIYRDNFGLALIGPISLVCVAVCVLTPSLSVSPGAATIVGGLTYPLYLLHQNIGYSVFARFGAESGRWSVGALLLLSLLFICWLIARFFEPLSRRFIKRWASAQTSFGVHER
ncbi:acyltransferase [Rhizobium daejeonense]|uniref:Acyltransferase n=2 Tax=Rhizobium daejeonense TaxID=240521 RepID=A0A6M1RY51_9HYPH|nr:acyltransferase [Rhizobium daejeonense]HCL67745.1 acyltransferase [Rhizobium sp.]